MTSRFSKNAIDHFNSNPIRFSKAGRVFLRHFPVRSVVSPHHNQEDQQARYNPNPTAKSSPTVFTRGRRRARTSDLMIRSRPPRWDTILDQIASDRCQPRAGLQRTELASISQRVMRTSSSNPQGVSISRNERLWNIGRAVRRSVRLGARKLHHLGPLFNFIGEEPAKISR